MGVDDTDAVTKGDVLGDQVPQERRLAGTGFSDDVNVLALIGSRYAKRLRLPPAVAFSNHDVWLVIHGSKTSRHSGHREVPVYRLPVVTSVPDHRQSALEHAGEVMATGLGIRTGEQFKDTWGAKRDTDVETCRIRVKKDKGHAYSVAVLLCRSPRGALSDPSCWLVVS